MAHPSNDATLHVKGCSVARTPEKLALLRELFAAAERSLCPQTPRHRAATFSFQCPWGRFTISCFAQAVELWLPADRHRLADVLAENFEELSAAVEIWTRLPPSELAVRPLAALLLGKRAATKRTRFICDRLIAHQSKWELVRDGDNGVQRQFAAVVESVRTSGIPSEAISLIGGRLEVRLPVLFRCANVEWIGGKRATDELQQNLNNLAREFQWDDGSRRFLPTTNKPHGRETNPGFVYDFEHMGVARGGLLDAMVDTHGPHARHAIAGPIRKIIRDLTAPTINPDEASAARRILGTSVAELSDQQIRTLIALAADVVGRPGNSPRTQSERLTAFRAHTATTLERFARAMPYSPRGSIGRTLIPGRGLISDQPDPGALDPLMRSPITSVAHGPWDESVAKAIAHLDDRMQRIVLACKQEIDAFREWREWMTGALDSWSLRESQFQTSDVVGIGAKQGEVGDWLAHGELREVTALCVTAAENIGLHTSSRYVPTRNGSSSVQMGPAARRLVQQFPHLIRWTRGAHGSVRVHALLLTRWYVPRFVQLAIEIWLQLETTFNRHTVRNLKREGVTLTGTTVELQSVKTKTSEVESATIEAAESSLRWGISEMLLHSDNVSTHWSPHERRLFVQLVRSSETGERHFGIGTDNKLLSQFILAHGLPEFTREQLRNQSAVHEHLTDPDPHVLQARLGHGDLKTTNVYIRQRVLGILNEANIAAFSRQLAASITWVVEGERAVTDKGMELRDVRRPLLFPLGDHPSASGSHADCDVWIASPQSPLVIDALRIEHLIRQRGYYARNWQRLRAESRERFSKVHLPRIEFVAALWEVVRDSHHGHLLADT